MEAIERARGALPDDPSTALRILGEALDGASAEATTQLASLAGQVLAAQGRLPQAEQRFRQALEAADQVPLPRLVRAQITVVQATVLASDPTRRAGLVEPLEQAITLLQQARDEQRVLSGLAVLVRLHLSVGNFDAALDRAGRLSTTAAALGRPTLDALARSAAGLALEAQGRLSSAAAALSHASDIAEDDVQQRDATDGATARQLAPRIRLARLRVASRRGRAAAATEHRQWLEAHDSADVEVRAAVTAEASALLESEDPLHAATLSWLGERLDPMLVRPRLEAMGRPDLARQHLDRTDPIVLSTARAAGPAWLWAVLAVDDARGMRQRGEVTRAVQTLEEALPVLQKLGFDLHAVLGALELARCLRIGGRHLEAAAHLDDARPMAEELGTVGVLGAIIADLAETRRALGDPEAALALARTITEPVPIVAVVRAMAALDLGQLDVAHQALAALSDVRGPLTIDVGLVRLRLMAAEGASTAEQAAWLHELLATAQERGWGRQQERLGEALASLTAAD